MNQICYFEIISNDLAASQEFYSRAFGGVFTPSSPHYTMWKPGTGIECGLQQEPREKFGPDANRSVVYIEVEDIEAKLMQAEALGGTVVRPKTLISAEYGYYGLLRDPQGTLVGLWSMH